MLWKQEEKWKDFKINFTVYKINLVKLDFSILPSNSILNPKKIHDLKS